MANRQSGTKRKTDRRGPQTACLQWCCCACPCCASQRWLSDTRGQGRAGGEHVQTAPGRPERAAAASQAASCQRRRAATAAAGPWSTPCTAPAGCCPHLAGLHRHDGRGGLALQLLSLRGESSKGKEAPRAAVSRRAGAPAGLHGMRGPESSQARCCSDSDAARWRNPPSLLPLNSNAALLFACNVPTFGCCRCSHMETPTTRRSRGSAGPAAPPLHLASFAACRAGKEALQRRLLPLQLPLQLPQLLRPRMMLSMRHSNAPSIAREGGQRKAFPRKGTL